MDFRISVIIDPRGAQTGAGRVGRALAGVDAQAQKTGLSLSRAFAFIGGVAAVRSTVGLLADFSQEISTAGAVAGASASELDMFRDVAQRLGTETRFSAVDAAEGLTFLSRAGFTASESLESIEGTLLLAQSGALGLGEAADIASNVLSGFRLSASETGRVVDVLSLAANSSNTNVSQLGDALKFVAPVAAGLGVSIEETAGAVGALSNAGLQASLAGTGLRRVLSELESPSSNSEKILAALGVTTDEVQVSSVGLTAALERLADAGIDTGTALELFGDRGGPAFEVLRSSIGDVEELTESLQDAEGTARRIADVMDDNLNGALLSVRSAFQGLVLAIGEDGGTGVLEAAARSTAAALRFLAENTAIVNGVLGGLAVASIPRVVTALRTLSLAIAGTGVGALVVALGATVGVLQTYGDQITVAADSTTTLDDVFTATGQVLSETFAPALTAVSALFSGLAATSDSFFTGFDFSLRGFVTIGARSLDAYIGFWRGAFNAIGNVLSTFSETLSLFGSTTSNFFQALGSANQQLLAGSFSDAATFARDAFLDFRRQNNTLFRNLREDIGDAVGEGFDEGFASSNFFEASVNQIFDRADDIARQRAAETGVITADAVAGAVTINTPEFNFGDGNLFGDGIGELPESLGISESFDLEADEIQAKGIETAGVLEQSLGSAFNSIKGAITGAKFDFEDFAKSVLSDILEIVANDAFRTFVDGITASPGSSDPDPAALFGAGAGSFGLSGGGEGGGGGGFFSSLLGAFGLSFGGGAMSGGDVEPGEAKFVGESGRELFAPSEPGTIIPAGETAALLANDSAPAAPVVQTTVNAMPQVVFVDDPDMVPSMVNSGELDESLLTFVDRKGRAINQITGGAST